MVIALSYAHSRMFIYMYGCFSSVCSCTVVLLEGTCPNKTRSIPASQQQKIKQIWWMMMIQCAFWWKRNWRTLQTILSISNWVENWLFAESATEWNIKERNDGTSSQPHTWPSKQEEDSSTQQGDDKKAVLRNHDASSVLFSVNHC